MKGVKTPPKPQVWATSSEALRNRSTMVWGQTHT